MFFILSPLIKTRKSTDLSSLHILLNISSSSLHHSGANFLNLIFFHSSIDTLVFNPSSSQSLDIAFVNFSANLIPSSTDLITRLGLGFAAFFFIKKMIDVSEVQESRKQIIGGITGDGTQEMLDVPVGVLVYEIEGPLFFGTVRKFEMAVERAGAEFKVLVIRMRNTIYLDAGGLNALEQCKAACDRKGVTIVLSGPRFWEGNRSKVAQKWLEDM